MKNLLKYLILCQIFVFLGWGGQALAVVTGQCSNCHTMHNSQGANSVVSTSNGDTVAQGALLNTDCLGCHSTSGSEPYVDGTPFVKGNGFSDTKCLAGGFFTDDDDPNHGGKSHSLGSTVTPAGYDGTWYDSSSGLSCAGKSGCHGFESATDPTTAIKGGHHGDNPKLGYRMLVVGDRPVAGKGASDYEYSLISTGSGDHNVYSAGSINDKATISELCGKCHGNFHKESGIKANDAWIRHPSDVAIPNGWDIATKTLEASDYINNPVGYEDVADESGTRYVTCLSCHRAHGTGHADLLRWDYSTQVAGSSTTYGCLGCHNKQRAQE
ncbi:MAG: cytochrome c3 family protein [Desulfonauticus sp.]|nr:cytochrome c3 family protein [Desulfonauticus sp.]